MASEGYTMFLHYYLVCCQSLGKLNYCAYMCRGFVYKILLSSSPAGPGAMEHVVVVFINLLTAGYQYLERRLGLWLAMSVSLAGARSAHQAQMKHARREEGQPFVYC